MSLCKFDANLACERCGRSVRKANTKRRCEVPDPNSPHIFSRVSHYAEAVRKWMAAGCPVRSGGEIDAILAEQCRPCPKYLDGACSLCECKVNSSRWALLNKIAMATEGCPLPEPRWMAIVGGQRQSAPTSAAKCQRTPIRVGFVLPILKCGGVERWHIDLSRALSKRSDVAVSGVAYTGKLDTIHAATAAELASLCPVVGAVDSHGIHRVATPSEAVYAVAGGSDVLIVWSVSGAILDALRATGLPIVGVSHGCGDWWMGAARRVATHWVAVTQAARAPICSFDTTIIENGVDIERLRPSVSRETTRAEAGIPLDARLVVSIGRISRDKRLPLLAAALEHLPADAWLWLVGDGAEAGVIREAAGKHAGRLVISPSRRDIGNVLAAADCFAFASPAEGYGLAPVEAIAAGVPLAATRVGILPDLGDVAAWIEEPATPAGCASSMGVALECSPMTLRRVAGGQAIVRARHSVEAMARRWVEYLTTVLAAR